MNYLSVEDLSKMYGEKVLFSALTFGLNKGDKVGLIARNGSGKTTLLKVLAGQEEAAAARCGRPTQGRRQGGAGARAGDRRQGGRRGAAKVHGQDGDGGRRDDGGRRAEEDRGAEAADDGAGGGGGLGRAGQQRHY